MPDPTFRPGDRVVKNPLTWLPGEFDAWAGVGVGVVVEPPFPPGDGEVDVRWPGGRCFQKASELLPAPDAFLCEKCGRRFPLGDDDEARAEAESNGFDPDDDCATVCDECYAAIKAAFPEDFRKDVGPPRYNGAGGGER